MKRESKKSHAICSLKLVNKERSNNEMRMHLVRRKKNGRLRVLSRGNKMLKTINKMAVCLFVYIPGAISIFV